jgi:glycosyltransferase involved in cell wall biosynthesis
VTKSDRPLVTFAIFSYNQERFIREAVEGALAQTYSPLEIILSDDCSTDETFAIMKQMVDNYTGPHELILNHNGANQGFRGHINTVVKRARGDLIVASAGDDISLPMRVERLVEKWLESKSSIAVLCSNVFMVDETTRNKKLARKPGETSITNFESLVGAGARVIGCSQAWSRQIFEVFGPIHIGIFQEDIAIPFRAALVGQIIYVDEPLVIYRRHPQGMWSAAAYLSTQEEMRSWYRAWARNLIFLQRGFARDAATYAKTKGSSDELLIRLNRILPLRRWEAHVEYALHRNISPVRKLHIILNGVTKGSSFKRIVRWLLMAFTLKLYVMTVRQFEGIRSEPTID